LTGAFLVIDRAQITSQLSRPCLNIFVSPSRQSRQGFFCQPNVLRNTLQGFQPTQRLQPGRGEFPLIDRRRTGSGDRRQWCVRTETRIVEFGLTGSGLLERIITAISADAVL
jgi:hypothetical protein